MPIPWNYPHVTVHPAALAFPLVDTDEFDALVEDIRQNGLQKPLVQSGNGSLLSGRARYAACQKLNIQPNYIVHRGNPWVFVIAENMETRRLTEQQRAMTGARIMPYKRPTNMVPTRVELAQLLGVSARAVSRASIVCRKALPDIIELVDSNRMLLTTAERVATQDPLAQENVAKNIRSGANALKVAPPAIPYGIRDIQAKNRAEQKDIEAPLKVATTTAAFLQGIATQLEGKEIIASPEDLRDARLIAIDLTRGALALRKLRKIVNRRIDLMGMEETEMSDNVE